MDKSFMFPNSLSDGQISLWRHQYTKQGNNAMSSKKKWLPNQNRDASSIVSRSRVVQAIPPPVTREFPPSCQDLQSVRQAIKRCRSHGYRAPPKLGFSSANTRTFNIGLPQPQYIKFNTEAYLEMLY